MMNTQLKLNSSKRFSAAILAVALSTGTAFSAGTVLDLSSAAVVTSGNFNGSFPGANAFDGDSGTRWASNQVATPDWIYVDLGDTYELDQVTIDWENSHGGDYTIRVFDGVAAPDPNTSLGSWTTIGSITGRASTVGPGGSTIGTAGTIDDIFDFGANTFTANTGEATTSSAIGGTGRFLMLHVTADGAGGGALSSVRELGVTVVPEPSSTALLGLGGLALILRRRK